MKYYIISGEASGDMHGANLIKEINALDHSSEFRCWGGDRMHAQPGVELVKHYKDLAFMGFLEVVQNLGTILKNIDFCKKDILEFKPDVLILIDYPGFNLRIAKFAKAANLKVFYYISPQIWAWKQSRVHSIKRLVDRMFVILPFEKEFYRKFDYNVDFVGHPLLDAIEEIRQLPVKSFHDDNGLSDLPIIALLPGSRKQEISVMLPIMLSIERHFPEHQFIVAAAPSLPESYYEQFISNKRVKVVRNQTYDLLEQASAALVTSGTATLETALFRVPEIVCYKGNFISYAIARNLVKVEYISLVNLIMGREIVKELIQRQLNSKELKKELSAILFNENVRSEMLKNYAELSERLGGKGASKKTASLMIQYLRE